MSMSVRAMAAPKPLLLVTMFASIMLCLAVLTGPAPAYAEGEPAGSGETEQAAEHTLSFDAKGGTPAPKAVSLKEGDAQKLPTVTRSGYTFGGWSYDGKTYKAGKQFTMPGSDAKLVAVWTKDAVGLQVQAVQQKSSSRKTVSLGKTAGKTSGSRTLSGIALKKAKGVNVSGSVKYRVYIAGKGWTSWEKDGSLAGYKASGKSVSAVKIKLSGALKKKYHVYYRANVKDYGWMGWAKDGESAGAVNLFRNVRAYQVKLVAAGDKKAAKKLKDKTKVAYAGKKENVEEFMGAVLARKVENRSSGTGWYVIVDTHVNHLAIFKGSRGNWKLVKSWRCSTGKPTTPTVKGTFHIGSKGYAFGHGYTCYYYSQISGNYLFHSIKYHQGTFRVKDGRLGKNVSKGCVRLALENAKWLQRNVPGGSGVYIY